VILKFQVLLLNQDNSNSVGIILFYIIVITIVIYFQIKKSTGDNFYDSEDNSNLDYLKDLLILTALVLRVDNQVKDKELNYTFKYLEHKFGKKYIPKIKRLLKKYISTEKDISKSLKLIDENQNITVKLQILNFLIKIATIDGYLTKKELIALGNICISFSFPVQQLKNLLAMNSYIIEGEEQKQYENKYKKSKFTTSKSRLKGAYYTLGLTTNASEKDIKKAYRKMVVLYHPDKTMHLDKSSQKDAKELFQKVNDAYDLLKEKLNF